MARKPAQVVSGAKAPSAEDRVQTVPAVPVQVPSAQFALKRDGFRRFASKYGGYRLQIESPSDSYDPITGKKTIHRGKVAQFVGGLLETDDPKVIAAITGSRSFGPQGSDMWDADAAEAAGLLLQAEAVIAALKQTGNEALLQRVMDSLGVQFIEEFVPPAAPVDLEA